MDYECLQMNISVQYTLFIFIWLKTESKSIWYKWYLNFSLNQKESGVTNFISTTVHVYVYTDCRYRCGCRRCRLVASKKKDDTDQIFDLFPKFLYITNNRSLTHYFHISFSMVPSF